MKTKDIRKFPSFFRHDGRVDATRQRTLAAGLFGLSAVIALVMPGSFVVETQGPAIDTKGQYEGHNIMKISGVNTYPSDTQMYMTTVSSRGNADLGVTGAEAFFSAFSKEAQLVPVRFLYAKEENADTVNKKNQQAMTSSQNSAAVLAAEKAGYTVTSTLVVSSVEKDSPAYGKLHAGDVLTSITVGGVSTPITSYSELSKVLARTAPGTEVSIEYTSSKGAGSTPTEGSSTSASAEESAAASQNSTAPENAVRSTVSLVTKAHRADVTGWKRQGSLLGIGLITTDVKNPVTVKYVVEGIGGPSAGMMFALTIYDQLTEGSLGGKEKIAGTGTISESGVVGAIGGIPHKMQGAAAQGAKYFLAPATNCAETIGYEPAGVKVFAVHTFDDAVNAAQSIASGNTSGLKTCKQVVEESPKS